jgi:hypothetical protein
VMESSGFTTQMTPARRPRRSRWCPRHVLGPDPVALGAVKTADDALEQEAARSEIEVPPAARGAVVARHGFVAAWTLELPPPQPDPDNDACRGEGYIGHGSSGDGQHPVECCGDAHVSPLPGKARFALEAPNLPRERHVRVFRDVSRSVRRTERAGQSVPPPVNTRSRDPHEPEESRKSTLNSHHFSGTLTSMLSALPQR